MEISEGTLDAFSSTDSGSDLSGACLELCGTDGTYYVKVYIVVSEYACNPRAFVSFPGLQPSSSADLTAVQATGLQTW